MQNTGNYISKLLDFIFFLWEHNHGPLAERGITTPFPGTVIYYIIGYSLWKNFIVVSLRTVTMSFFRNPNSSSSCLSKSNRAFALLRRFLRKKKVQRMSPYLDTLLTKKYLPKDLICVANIPFVLFFITQSGLQLFLIVS